MGSKRITCIECPQGCQLEVDIEGGHVIKVTGQKCPKGETYAKTEIENPMRVLTTTVLTEGLELKLLPVRTSKPIPKAKLNAAAAEARKVRLAHPVKAGDVLVKDFLSSGIDLIATREAK